MCLHQETTVAKEQTVRDCDIEVSEFELQSYIYVPFRINTHGKGMNPLPVIS